MKSTRKGDDEAGTWFLRPCSKKKKTMVLGSVHGDGASSGASQKDSMGGLQKMVQDLEKMDEAWRGSLTSQPSNTEQILYLLILRRVTSDIFLFHRERNTGLEALPGGGSIIKDLRDKVTPFGVSLANNNLDISGGEEEDEAIPSDDANIELRNSWECMGILIYLAEDLRNSFSQWPSPEKLKTGQSAKIEIMGEETRVETLKEILCGLAERTRKRSYGPPGDKELTCYREIRKWVTSSIIFIDGKTNWIAYWEYHLRKVGEVECGNHFLVERVRRCREKWHNFLICDNTMLVKFPTPAGHQIAVAFDELPEFWSLLNGWRRRFSNITTRFSKGESMDVKSTYCGVKVEVSRGNKNRVQQELEGEVKNKKKMKHDDMFGQTCKPRAKYIVDILSISMSMDTKSCLSSREVRLYARILEHVRSSIWLFFLMKIPREEEYYEYHRSIHEKRQGKKYHDLSQDTLLVAETVPWRGNREESLKEIVRLVEEVESSFMCSSPTANEVKLYEVLLKHMNVDLMEPRCSQELTGFEHQAYQIARCLLQETWDMEIEFAHLLMKEFGDALRTIFPGVPQETQVTEWLPEHEEDAKNMLKELVMASPLGLEYLDHLLLSLHEAYSLVGHIAAKVINANENISIPMYEKKQYQVPIHDCWVALTVAEASRFVKDGGNIKL